MEDILISKFTTQIPRVGATPATPGFAESEGQDPVAPSGTPQVYTPVTIGSPLNGLSIDGSQVLTIGLASTSTTGALSSTDWNTFNGKIGGTIASGQVAFGTGVNTIGGDSDFIWDSVNNRLRINTSDTTANLSIGGSLNVTDGTVIIRSIIVGTDGTFGTNTNHNLVFRTNSTSRWSILTSGILESNGSQTIRTSTGDLAIQTGSANGNIIIIPNGTGIAQIKTSGTGANLVVGNSLNVTDLTTTIRSVVSAGVGFFGTSSNHPLVLRTNASNRLRILGTGEVGIGDITPTNTLDVNGTARIRTISNLGSAATSVLVPSATGVVSLRTLAEFRTDLAAMPDQAFERASDTVIFDNDYIIGNAAARTGNILFDFTGAKLGAVTRMIHNSGTKPTIPATAVLLSGSYVTSVNNYIWFVITKTSATQIVEVTISQVQTW